MTTQYPATPRHADDSSDGSIGQLIGNITEDLSRLFRQEIQLARTELREEAGKAGRAAGMLSAAGVAGLLTVLLLSLAVMFGLGNVLDLGWAALIVAVFWAIVGAVLFATGRARLRTVDPVPQQTVETLKEDAQWLRKPTA